MEPDCFDVGGQCGVVQVAPEKNIDVPDRQIGIEERKYKSLLFYNDGSQYLLVQKTLGINWHSGFETQLFHDIQKFGEICFVHGHSDINIHGDPFDTVKHTSYSAADDEVDFGID